MSSEPKNNLDELREHLFATLRGVKDGSMDIDRAKTVVQVADALIDSARVEVEFTRVTGRESGSRFLPAPDDANKPLPPGITGITRHRMKG